MPGAVIIIGIVVAPTTVAAAVIGVARLPIRAESILIGAAAAVSHAHDRRVVVPGGRLLHDRNIAAAVHRLDTHVAVAARERRCDTQPASPAILAVEAVGPHVSTPHRDLDLTVDAARPCKERT